MLRVALISIIFILCFLNNHSFSQTTDNSIDDKMESSSSRGMKEVQITSGYKVVVPKGTKLKKIGGQIIVPAPEEETLARIDKIEDEIANISSQKEAILSEIKALRKYLDTRLEMISEALGQLQSEVKNMKSQLNSPDK